MDDSDSNVRLDEFPQSSETTGIIFKFFDNARV